MSKKGIKFEIEISPNTLSFFQTRFPNKLIDARKKAVEAAGIVWADETKELTTVENHIDTGLYVNSIGYTTGSPSKPLHQLNEQRDVTVLNIGANVEYAMSLEKRYSLMSRGLDIGSTRMGKVAETQIKNTLSL